MGPTGRCITDSTNAQDQELASQAEYHGRESSPMRKLNLLFHLPSLMAPNGSNCSSTSFLFLFFKPNFHFSTHQILMYKYMFYYFIVPFNFLLRYMNSWHKHINLTWGVLAITQLFHHNFFFFFNFLLFFFGQIVENSRELWSHCNLPLWTFKLNKKLPPIFKCLQKISFVRLTISQRSSQFKCVTWILTWQMYICLFNLKFCFLLIC